MPTPNREAFLQHAGLAHLQITRMVEALDTPSPFDDLLLAANRERLGVFAVLLTLYGLAVGEAREPAP